MSPYPTSLIDFQKHFPDDAACAAYLYELRWPDGFRCPKCAHHVAWELKTKPWTYECASCHHQASLRAGTIMQDSKLAFTTWLWAAWLMATHSNGISAKQLGHQLGLGSYKTAWLLCRKLRQAMVDPDRNQLSGLVEIDETSIPYRTRDDPPAGGRGRSHEGKIMLAGGVEIGKDHVGRIRLEPIADYSADSLHAFIKDNIAEGACARTDGWSAYEGAPGVTHEPHVIGAMAAHIVLEWIHRVFANLKRWALGVYHGLRHGAHIKAYLDEFVFRFNRRKRRPAGFRTLLRIAMKTKPETYKMLTKPETAG
jgi:hypothetical protein